MLNTAYDWRDPRERTRCRDPVVRLTRTGPDVFQPLCPRLSTQISRLLPDMRVLSGTPTGCLSNVVRHGIFCVAAAARLSSSLALCSEGIRLDERLRRHARRHGTR